LPVVARVSRLKRSLRTTRQGLPLLAGGSPLSILGLSVFATLTVAACNKPKGLEPAPYVAPVPGTMYTYTGFKNLITASDGWRVRFADESGKRAVRVGVFITDDPDTPSQIDTAALSKLWPLTNGREVSLVMTSGSYKSRWLFKVIGQAQVAVPAGVYEAYVVQGVQRPDSIADPEKQTVFTYTWWYAPEVAAVVKFQTQYISGPASGQIIGSLLQRIDTVALKGADTSKVKPRDSASLREKR
jgi:hypothetical protein